MVERLLPKQNVASSNLVSRFQSASPVDPTMPDAQEARGNGSTDTRSIGSRIQVVKEAVCKTVITSSILVGSSKFLRRFCTEQRSQCFVFVLCLLKYVAEYARLPLLLCEEGVRGNKYS